MKNKLFNGLICIILCVLLCCLVTGCGNDEKINSVTTDKSETTANVDGDSSDKTLPETTSEKNTSETTTQISVEQTVSTEDPKNQNEIISSKQKTTHTHKHIKKSVVSPTCSEKGYTVYQCACGDSYNADYKDACGHSVIIDKAVAATCTKSGLAEGSHCSICNTVIVAQKQISAKGHSWSKWTVTKAASVGVKGEEKRICNTCNISETRSVAAITQDEYEVFKEKIGVYYTDNVKYEYLKNHFDYSAYIQVYTLNKASSCETNIINEFKKHFGFAPTAKVSIEKVGIYVVNDKVETVYSYSIDDKTYPFLDHELYDVYHQLCVDGKSHWVGFAIEGGANDDWEKLMSTSKVQALKKEMYKTFYEKTDYSAEYITSHEDDFCMGYISQAGTMRTQDGRLIEVLYIYCREK